MPLYFFNVRNGFVSPDTAGTELPDEDAARREAVRTVGEMLKDQPEEFIGKDWRMIVTDEAGSHVLTVMFSSVERK